MARNVSGEAIAVRTGMYGIFTVTDIPDSGEESSIVYNITANGKGFQIERKFSDGFEDTYVKFNSFTYPDDVQDSEKDLIQMLTERFDDVDREMIELGSLLVIHWQAGTDDEEVDSAVRKFTKRLEI
ncbi:hypothetical protein KASHIRA_02360 [Serratia phage vB_SmaM-Kashira]|nr:hypothetical protein KASHIRA_02360 [Serratia phage vB_SmaM-Kashira]